MVVRIDSIKQNGKNDWLVEYDGWHYEGTIRKVINELLNYERKTLKEELK